MVNPFSQLKADYLASVGWEEVEGNFRCQTIGCGESVVAGLYNDDKKLVTWKCSNGHVSSMNYDYNE